MAPINPRDMSRTSGGKRQALVKANTKPPTDQGGWMAMTRDLLESVAVRTLSGNARKALDRLILENIAHNRTENGNLIVTHQQFSEYGVTGEYVADAIDELVYKGLLKAARGKAGNGTPHPTRFTLTFDGTFEGAKATDEWKRFPKEGAVLWSEVIRKEVMAARKLASKKNMPLRNSEVTPLRNSEVRKAS